MAGGSTTPEASLTVGSQVATPLHVQRLEHSLRLNSFLSCAQKHLSYTVRTSDDDSSDQSDANSSSSFCFQETNGTHSTRQERRYDRMRRYNLFKVKKSRKWIKTLLLSDSSESSDDELNVTSSDIDQMLKIHKLKQISAVEFSSNSKLHQYQYLSAGLLSSYDKFYEHQKLILGSKKKFKDRRALRRKVKAKKIKMETSDEFSLSQQEEALMAEALKLEDSSNQGCEDFLQLEALCMSSSGKVRKKSSANQQPQPAVMAARRRRLWTALAKKEINRAQKQMITAHKEVLSNARRLASACQRECRRSAILSQKVMKDTPSRSRRLTKEMLLYWKRYEKVEREHRRRAEKEAQEQLRMDIERREAKRQQRKLNFLITQTELYAHFMSRKIAGLSDVGEDQILKHLNEVKDEHPLVDDDYDCEAVKATALKNAKEAFETHMEKNQSFSAETSSALKIKRDPELSQDFNENFRLTNPSLSTEEDLCQPNIFFGKLKTYQLKGMNWLNNLYDKGINGILADEMGLGKTVQTIAFLATLAESQGIWGPFLIIAPASTLHNWQQEFSKFVPKFKVLPYWGNTGDRKILRKFWSLKGDLHVEASPFHVLVTSYQLVVQDVKYFQRIKWQYMVLDEAQAIKSTSSVRWKILLGFSCRNRLLLTGTPIQNSMAELWALLHFIMPTLFDSHDEFNEWFSKDIESHAENKSTIDEKHLSRLHMILKPFMLRRIKKDVENELSDKIEILVKCGLTQRQRDLYRNLRSKISIEDLMQTSLATSNSATSSLMNLVMQFRKVCNHPDLFERREARVPYHFSLDVLTIPRLLFREFILYRTNTIRSKIIYQYFTIFTPEYIHHASFPKESTQAIGVSDCPFSFLRLISLSPSDASKVALAGLLSRWMISYLMQQEAYRIHYRSVWSESRFRLPFLLLPSRLPTTDDSSAFFTDPCSDFYTFSNHWHHPLGADPNLQPVQNLQDLAASQKAVRSCSSLLRDCQATFLPRFLLHHCPKVSSPLPQMYVADPNHRCWWRQQQRPKCPRQNLDILLRGPEAPPRGHTPLFLAPPPGGLEAIRPPNSWNHIIIPDKETVVTDSGKLRVLDVLLGRLKVEGHRVLIYSQMTRMIDLLEEYMWHRKHTYMRLDGSSKISDRRDMVADFQARTDIFVFLLSTRAGGLGINLTAADTVIFYDSDWNPTVDQQAMDRAHRLGQTKQVTVYRLICSGTIEERILDRACQKSEIQRMVISGGNFKPDTLKPKEVVSLLLDDEELERKFHQRQEERKFTDDYGLKDKKRKKDKLGKPPGKRKRLTDEPQAQAATTTPAAVSLSVTPPEQVADTSVLSVESVPPSPYHSENSVSSNLVAQEESSNDESPLVVVDDSNPLPPMSSTVDTPMPSSFFSLTGTGWSTIDGTLEVSPPGTPTSLSLMGISSSGSKRGRTRGRPRGSGRGTTRAGTPSGSSTSSSRGARSNTLATTAAELAAAQAGKSAAFAAYNFALQNLGTPPVTTSARSGVKGSRSSRGIHHSVKLLQHSQTMDK